MGAVGSDEDGGWGRVGIGRELWRWMGMVEGEKDVGVGG